MKEVDPDIIALCETKNSGRLKKDELEAYEIVDSNITRGKEGFLVGVRKGSFNIMREITETELQSIMTVRIEYPKMNVRVIVVHAPQEKEKKELRDEFFEEVLVQVERGVTSEDKVIIVGDFNARIIHDENNNIGYEKESPNGKLLSELIDKYSLSVGNFHTECRGKWTRIQVRKKELVKSVLDYVLLPKSMSNSLREIMIDEEKFFCPYGVKSIKGSMETVYSDHCPIIFKISLETGSVRKTIEKKCCWSFTEEGYASHAIESAAPIKFDLKAATSTEVYSSWQGEFEKLLSKSFDKRTFKDKVTHVNSKIKKVRRILHKVSKQGKVQREVAKIYHQKMIEIECRLIAESRASRLKKTTSQLTVDEKFSPMAYWKLKKAADKNVRQQQDGLSIIAPNGIEVTGEESVKDLYREEFISRLANRDPAPGWEEYTKATNIIVRDWLKGESYSNSSFTIKELNKAVVDLNAESSPGLDQYPSKLFKS